MSAAELDDWSVKDLVTEVVGSGPKSADDLTRAQARLAADRILDRRPDPTTLGAFLLANRWKRNTPEELGGFVDVMRERSVQPAAPRADPVDCGPNYDGKHDSALLGVGAGVVAAAAGTPVVVHSGDRVPATRGVTYRHVLDELGIVTDLSPAASARMVDATGFGFYYQPRFNPLVHELLDRREAIGVRTFINTIETLANPADANAHLGSFFHLSFAERVIKTTRASHQLDYARVIMVQGLEGYDDLRPGRTRLASWTGGEITDWEIDTSEYGFAVDRAALGVADVAGDSARLTEEILRGERDDAFADAVALNAGLRIYAAGNCPDLGTGVARARSAIESGDAVEVLADLRAFRAEGNR